MNLKLWLGLAISAVFLWLAIRNVDLGHAWEYMQTINAVWLIPSVILVAAEIMVRAFKWQILLLPLKRCSFWKLNNATLIGLMANNVLPARAGEFVRAYAGARLAGIPYSTAFATVVIDRVLDGLTVSALFILVLIFQPLIMAEPLPDWLNRGGYLAAAVYMVTLTFLVGLIVQRARTLALATFVMRPLPSRLRNVALNALTTFVEGLGIFKSIPLLVAATLLSLVVWVLYGVGIYLMFLMFNMSLTIFQSFVVLLILTIVLTLPGAPGFVGAMELGIKSSLVLFGVSDSQAFALAAVYHVMQYIPVTAGGFIALWFERLTMAEIASVAPNAPDDAGDGETTAGETGNSPSSSPNGTPAEASDGLDRSTDSAFFRRPTR